MRFADALQTLGIDAQTDRKAARRVYLRLVRLHKPEQDPEGFKRIREAWETARPLLPRTPRTAVVPPEPEPAPELEPAPTPEPASSPTPPPTPESESESAPESVPEPVAWSPPSSPAEIDAWVLRDESAAQPPSREPFAVPPLNRPRWTGPTPARRAQDAIDAAEVDATAALEAVQLACSDALGGRRPEPALTDLLRIVLLLHRSGAAHEAQSAWTAVQEWISGAGIGLRVGNSVSVWLALTRELSDLPAHFPPEVRRTLASAVLDRHPAHARQVLVELYRARPHTALDAAELLEVYAPNLFGMFGTALRDPVGTPDPPEPDPRVRPEAGDTRDRWSVGWAILLGILITVCLRVCVDDFDSPRPTPVFEPIPIHIPAFDPIEPMENIPPIELEGLRALQTWRFGIPPVVEGHYCISMDPDDQVVCRDLRSLDDHLERNDCDAAMDSRAALATHLTDPSPSDVNDDQPSDRPERVTLSDASRTDLLELVDDQIRACRVRAGPEPDPTPNAPTGDPP